ncbi:hypothetical protein HU200_064493 [Digitaria exilis]|uniref:Pentatricopeptide repeat-containing protein n=1 Tax=Digitaria exilis TaxID=1010633 RepID=A0A835A1C0_9POAL|nr:hypothetical protein HU200_064493 [Digitaria exilis]
MSCSPEAALLLLVTLARHRRFAAAATLFSTARCSTTGALNSLLAALCSPTSSYPASFLRIAPSVLLRAAPHAAPDAATFRILTSALCRAHQPTAAADLLRCMPGLLLDPEPRHCRAVLASLCRFAPAPDALAFLDDMRRWGVSPSRPDHGAVLDALLREGMVPEAYELVAKQMDSYDGVAPGLPEFERVLRAFRESGSSVAWLLEMWTRRGRRGLRWDAPALSELVAALREGGHLAPARGLLLDILRCPDGCVGEERCPMRPPEWSAKQWENPDMASVAARRRTSPYYFHDS